MPTLVRLNGNDTICKIVYISALQSEMVNFDINPVTVDIELEPRINLVKTLGGYQVLSWYSDEGWSGWGRLLIRLSGVANIYKPKQEKERETTTVGVLEGLLQEQGLSLRRERYITAELRRKLEQVEKQTPKKYEGKEALAKLYRYINAEWSVRDNNGKVDESRWLLTLYTPFFNLGTESLSLYVKPASSMTIRENAGNPFMPSWSANFMVIDNNEIRDFMIFIEGLYTTI